MSNLRLGIDIGSTTAKVMILNRDKDLVFSAYCRHNAEMLKTVQAMLADAKEKLADVQVDVLITGSAGMVVYERFALPFIQEVIASAEVVRQLYPQVKTLIDIGGEDAKMIFTGMPDIRMNGSCAGGTGAFIDEMSSLLNVPVADLDVLASKSTMIYLTASRCGVFAKTDLQNLLSRDIPRADISASVFHAVVLQTLTTLARGYSPKLLILFCGGPLTFLPALKIFYGCPAPHTRRCAGCGQRAVAPRNRRGAGGIIHKANIHADFFYCTAQRQLATCHVESKPIAGVVQRPRRLSAMGIGTHESQN
jgi:activator of 2-hydroxyglutaryl-CoA dehydratase